METGNGVGPITKQALKQRTILFLLFLVLLVTATIAGEFVSDFSPFIGFVLYTGVLLTVNISDALYSVYFKRVSYLSPEAVSKEIRWIPLVVLLSMLSIFVVGSFLNIPLKNYQTQANQVVGLIGLTYLFKEFLFVFLAVNTYNKMKRNPASISSNYGLVVFEWILTGIIYVHTLLKIAFAFPSPDKYLSVGFVILQVVVVGWYIYNKFKTAQPVMSVEST